MPNVTTSFEKNPSLTKLTGEALRQASNLDHGVRLARYIFREGAGRGFERGKDHSSKQHITVTPWVPTDMQAMEGRLLAIEPRTSWLGQLPFRRRSTSIDTPIDNFMIQHKLQRSLNEEPLCFNGARLDPLASAISPDKPHDQAGDFNIITQLYVIARGLSIEMPSLWFDYDG